MAGSDPGDGSPSGAEDRPLWKVVGGADKGGILVRTGEHLGSEAEERRLETGALVRQLTLAKDRLFYELLSGAGPSKGWVSVRISGKDLLVMCSQALAKTDGLDGEPPPLRAPTTDVRPSRRWRILALHGGGSNTNIMQFQTMPLRKLLGDRAEWEYLNGRRLWDHDTDPNEMLKAIAKGMPFHGWYAVKIDEPGGPTGRPYLEKLHDESVVFTYEEVEAGVDYVLEIIQQKGPFDVLLGFSQGCIITHLVAALLRERGQPIPWKLSVQFCGMRVRDNRYEKMLEEPLSVPCVQVYGRQDDMYEYGRQSQPKMYEEPIILEHDEGHKFPSKDPQKSEIYARILEEMQRRCV